MSHSYLNAVFHVIATLPSEKHGSCISISQQCRDFYFCRQRRWETRWRNSDGRILLLSCHCTAFWCCCALDVSVVLFSFFLFSNYKLYFYLHSSSIPKSHPEYFGDAFWRTRLFPFYFASCFCSVKKN